MSGITCILFEKKWSECVEIESPVSPDVTTFAYIVSVLEAVSCESLIELIGILKEEICVTAGKPVKLVTCLLDALELSVELRSSLCTH